MIKETGKNWIKFLSFRDVLLWDVKRYSSEKIKSDYPIVKLGFHIQEQSQKVKLFDFPEEEFGILGVNNKTGIFDAYKEIGANINQAYKKMEKGWLAYNPYRVNVGSIGMKTDEQEHKFISPAYVVFSCKDTLLPDFLFKIFKTHRFNKIIKDSTTGSVRQNLTIDILKSLDIVLPNKSTQQELLNKFYIKIAEAEKYDSKLNAIADKIEDLILSELGLSIPPERKAIKGLQFFDFKSLLRWDALSNDARIQNYLTGAKYPLKTLGSVYNFVSRGWQRRNHEVETFNYIEIGAIDPVLGILEVSSIKIDDAPSRATQTVRDGDLIIGTTRPYLKKFSLINPIFDGHVCSSGFSIIEQSNNYNLFFLKEFLMSFYGIEQMKNRMTGGSYPAITINELKELKIPLPPLDIQNRIAKELSNYRLKMISLINLSEEKKKDAIRGFEQAIFKL